MNDLINHPRHYTSHPSGVECIEVTEEMCFCLGNAFKYLFRRGEKGCYTTDLKKALWYVRRSLEHGTPSEVLTYGMSPKGEERGRSVVSSEVAQNPGIAVAMMSILDASTCHDDCDSFVYHLTLAAVALEALINEPG